MIKWIKSSGYIEVCHLCSHLKIKISVRLERFQWTSPSSSGALGILSNENDFEKRQGNHLNLFILSTILVFPLVHYSLHNIAKHIGLLKKAVLWLTKSSILFSSNLLNMLIKVSFLRTMLRSTHRILFIFIFSRTRSRIFHVKNV